MRNPSPIESKSRTSKGAVRHGDRNDLGIRMEAIVQTGYGAPADVLSRQTVERPTIGDDEVLVRVRATSVNTPDWAAVTGTPVALRAAFGVRAPKTRIRGSDVAGEVCAVGADVTDLKPGDEVFGSLWNPDQSLGSGAFAEYVSADPKRLIKKPDGIGFEAAAASVMSGLTALIAIREVAKVGPGTKVLINGASGGVGTFAVQIAKALGAEVTGVCSTRNVSLVRSLGADHVIDYTQEDFTRSGARYDVILDNVMNHSPRATARALAPEGVLVPNSLGTTGGWFSALPRMGLAAVMGLGPLDVRFADLEVDRERLHDLVTMLEAGHVRPVIDTVYPFEEAAAAVTHMMRHRARGNIVIAGPTATGQGGL